ncbi:hypothetical protein PENTCL1PPCAC_20187, partial [Pristionchus entomophagus]
DEEEEEKKYKINYVKPTLVRPDEVDIAFLLVAALPMDLNLITVCNGWTQEIFQMRPSEKEMEQLNNPFIEDFRKSAIMNWKGAEKEDGENPDDWQKNVENRQILEMTPDWLRSENYEYQSRFYIHLETAYLNSHLEFYGRPIRIAVEKQEDKENERMERDKDDGFVMLKEADAIIRGNTILTDQATELSLYYSKENNRIQLAKNEIDRVIEAGKRMYAICRVRGDRAEYTGAWQRVEVMRANMHDATVRFVDSGGSDMVMLGALFHIHPDHCRWRALCVQLCIHGLVLLPGGGNRERESIGYDGDEKDYWEMHEKENTRQMSKVTDKFAGYMRGDLPMAITVYPDSVIPRDTFSKPQPMAPVNHTQDAPKPKPYERPGVFFVEEIKVHSSFNIPEKDFIPLMIDEGWAKRDPEYPFPLTH